MAFADLLVAVAILSAIAVGSLWLFGKLSDAWAAEIARIKGEPATPQVHRNPGIKRHLVLLGAAAGALVAIWAGAIFLKLSRLQISVDNAAALVAGALAVGASIPLIGALILFASRPPLRNAWLRADSSIRGLVLLYVASDTVAATIAWVVFVVIVRTP